jgi:uncharacterized protein (TIGR02466 family)
MTTSHDPLRATGQAAGSFTLFPSVCLQTRHDGAAELNARLTDVVLAMERTVPGLSSQYVSIKGGYHSDTKFFEHDHLAVGELRRRIENDLRTYIPMYWQATSRAPLAEVARAEPLAMQLWGWAVVMRDGDASAPHTHPNAHISGVYYVSSAGEAGEGAAGQLTFSDPRSNANGAPIVGQINTVGFDPTPGTALYFPSYLSHYVLPFRGPGQRISIAFNVRFEGAATGGR